MSANKTSSNSVPLCQVYLIMTRMNKYKKTKLKSNKNLLHSETKRNVCSWVAVVGSSGLAGDMKPSVGLEWSPRGYQWAFSIWLTSHNDRFLLVTHGLTHNMQSTRLYQWGGGGLGSWNIEWMKGVGWLEKEDKSIYKFLLNLYVYATLSHYLALVHKA